MAPTPKRCGSPFSAKSLKQRHVAIEISSGALKGMNFPTILQRLPYFQFSETNNHVAAQQMGRKDGKIIFLNVAAKEERGGDSWQMCVWALDRPLCNDHITGETWDWAKTPV